MLLQFAAEACSTDNWPNTIKVVGIAFAVALGITGWWWGLSKILR
jgi:hypothetical protein